MKKTNFRVMCYIYRYCVCYVYQWKVILTYEDWGYYLGGRLWWDIDLLKIEQSDEMTAHWVLRIVKALQFKKYDEIRYKEIKKSN